MGQLCKVAGHKGLNNRTESACDGIELVSMRQIFGSKSLASAIILFLPLQNQQSVCLSTNSAGKYPDTHTADG